MRTLSMAVLILAMTFAIGCTSYSTPVQVEQWTPDRHAPVAVAILDTGARVTHDAIRGHVLAVVNLSGVGAEDDVTDHHGHGTGMAGLVVEANPKALLVIVKVADDGTATDAELNAGMTWVIENSATYNITCCVMSWGSWPVLEPFETPLRGSIRTLRALRIPVSTSAGNRGLLAPGMGYPAIFPETFSVGACDHRYMIEPWSCRILEGPYRTDVFTYGWAMCATPYSDTSTSRFYGTSISAASAAGIISRLQEDYLKRFRHLPDVDDLERAARWRRNPACPVLTFRDARRYLRRYRR